MKVGIITFHKVYSFGAVCQCYALQQYLKKQGYQAEIIDYSINGYLENRKKQGIGFWIKKAEKILNNPIGRISIIKNERKKRREQLKYETELKTNDVDIVTKASIYKMEKLVVMCTECKQIYFVSMSFEGSFKSQYVTLESVELFDGEVIEVRNLINRIYSEYEDAMVDIATDDYVIKVLSKSEDDEKTNTRYVYLKREDSILYADLQSE